MPLLTKNQLTACLLWYTPKCTAPPTHFCAARAPYPSSPEPLVTTREWGRENHTTTLVYVAGHGIDGHPPNSGTSGSCRNCVWYYPSWWLVFFEVGENPNEQE